MDRSVDIAVPFGKPRDKTGLIVVRQLSQNLV